jgi:hypothetical protein
LFRATTSTHQSKRHSNEPTGRKFLDPVGFRWFCALVAAVTRSRGDEIEARALRAHPASSCSTTHRFLHAVRNSMSSLAIQLSSYLITVMTGGWGCRASVEIREADILSRLAPPRRHRRVQGASASFD